MFFIHRVVNAVTMMYNEADEITACHFIRPSTYFKHPEQAEDSAEEPEADDPDQHHYHSRGDNRSSGLSQPQ